MIKIELSNNKLKQIVAVKIYGHSNYAEYGKDIVCSAVSGIVQGMFNAMLKLCNNNNMVINLEPNNKIQGSIIVKNLEDNKLQLLLKAMYYQLYTIKLEFPKIIMIKKEEVI